MSNKHTITRRLPMTAILTLLTIFAVATPTQAQPDLQIRQIGAWGGSVDAAVIEHIADQTIAYIGSGTRLVILNVTDPENIIELGSTVVGTSEEGGGIIRDLQVRDGFAYVAAWWPGRFSVVDVSDLTNPVVLAAGLAGSALIRVGLHGDFAMTLSQKKQQDCFDISNPEQPIDLGACLVGGGGDTVLVSGDYYYSAASDPDFGWVAIWDISDFDPPNTPIAELKFPEGAGTTWFTLPNLALNGDHLYLTWYTPDDEEQSEIFVIDVSNHNAPFLAGMWSQTSGTQENYHELGRINGVSASQGRLYVSFWATGIAPNQRRALAVFDIETDPTSPILLGEYWYEGWASSTGLTVDGTTVYLHEAGEGLVILDASDPANPERIGNYFSPAWNSKAALDAEHLYVTDFRFGVSTLDVSDARSPSLLGSYEIGPFAWGIEVQDDLAYVSGGLAGGAVLDVSDPTAPTLAGAFPPLPPGYIATGMELFGDVAHMGARRNNSPGFIHNYDVTDVENITLLGSVGVGFNGAALTIATTLNGIGHVSNGGDLVTVSLTDPENPFFIGQVNVDGFQLKTQDLALDGDLLYVGDWNGTDATRGLHIFNVSDPYAIEQIAYVGQSPNFEPRAVTVNNGRAYTGGKLSPDGPQLVTFDVSNPAIPVLSAAHQAGRVKWTDLIVDGPVVYGITPENDAHFGAGVLTYLVYVAGDFNDDGGVDELDFDAFANCFTGPDVEPGDATCLIFDFDIDNDIDCADWEAFKLAWTGKGDPPTFLPCDGPPPCPWDIDGSGSVGASDLLSLLASWGPCKGCPADFDSNGIVGASDLLALLANWGVCP